MLPIFQRKLVLKDVDQRLLPCQAALTIEQEIPKASITRLGKPPRLTNSRKSTIHVVRFKLLSSHPTKDLCWRMTTIFPFFVRQVFLEIVIQDPLFMCRNEILPGLSRFKIPVSHTSLYIKRRFYQILPALPLLNFFLLNPKSLVNLHGPMIPKHAAVVADQGRRTSMFTNRRVEHRNILLEVLPSGHSGSQDCPRIALQDADAVNHLST